MCVCIKIVKCVYLAGARRRNHWQRNTSLGRINSKRSLRQSGGISNDNVAFFKKCRQWMLLTEKL